MEFCEAAQATGATIDRGVFKQQGKGQGLEIILLAVKPTDFRTPLARYPSPIRYSENSVVSVLVFRMVAQLAQLMEQACPEACRFH
ncbi:hypothetical protein A6R68_07930, partial [Neotoma lepida]